MAVLRFWPRPPKWPIQPGTVDPGQRWVWHTRPRLIIPIWEHVSALTNQRHRRPRYSRGAELWLQNTSMSMLRTRYGPALSLPTTDGHELEPPNNGNVSWSADEPYTTAFVVKSRSGGPATRHIFRSGSSSTGNHILFTTTGPVPNARHDGAGGSVTISGGSMVNDTTWHTLLTTWRPHFFGLYLDGNLVASSTAANTATSIAWSIFRFGWGFSTSQDFNGDIALIACFAGSWTPAMIRRWNADPFGFLRPWNEIPALMGSAPPMTPPSTAGGVVVCLMG
jgi:hypothetical protein